MCLVCLGIQSKLVWQKGGGAKNFDYLPLQCLNAHVDILESSAHKKHKAAKPCLLVHFLHLVICLRSVFRVYQKLYLVSNTVDLMGSPISGGVNNCEMGSREATGEGKTFGHL